MRVWVITNGKGESFTSVHASKQSAEKYKEELEEWSQTKLQLLIKETILKI